MSILDLSTTAATCAGTLYPCVLDESRACLSSIGTPVGSGLQGLDRLEALSLTAWTFKFDF